MHLFLCTSLFPLFVTAFFLSFLFNLESSYAKKSIARLTEQIEEAFYF